jgi:hypothetical protein
MTCARTRPEYVRIRRVHHALRAAVARWNLRTNPSLTRKRLGGHAAAFGS